MKILVVLAGDRDSYKVIKEFIDGDVRIYEDTTLSWDLLKKSRGVDKVILLAPNEKIKKQYPEYDVYDISRGLPPDLIEELKDNDVIFDFSFGRRDVGISVLFNIITLSDFLPKSLFNLMDVVYCQYNKNTQKSEVLSIIEPLKLMISLIITSAKVRRLERLNDGDLKPFSSVKRNLANSAYISYVKNRLDQFNDLNPLKTDKFGNQKLKCFEDVVLRSFYEYINGVFPEKLSDMPDWDRLYVFAEIHYNVKNNPITSLILLREAAVSKYCAVLGLDSSLVVNRNKASSELNLRGELFWERLREYRNSIAHAKNITLNKSSSIGDLKELFEEVRLFLDSDIKPLDHDLYLGSGFSYNMLRDLGNCSVKFSKISVEEAKKLVENGFKGNYVGHQSTCDIMAHDLGLDSLEANRGDLTLNYGDRLLILNPKKRLPSFKEFSAEELKDVGYDYVLIEVVGNPSKSK